MSTSRETTLDTVFAGSLTCLQHREGYRFNQDSVILAHFVYPDRGEQVLDLGTGCGIIGLVLAYRFPSISLVGLEIQSDLAILAGHNAANNGFADRYRIIQGDFNDPTLLVPGSFDRIVCNPPYMDPAHSRRPALDEVAIARQGVHAGLPQLVGAAARVLVDGGRIDMIYPAGRQDLLFAALQGSGLEPVKSRAVRNHPDAPDMLVMVEAQKNGGKTLEVLPPFIIGPDEGGEYSPEMRSCYET